jgi:hypothetical protein
MISRIYRYKPANLVEKQECFHFTIDSGIRNLEKYYIFQMYDTYVKIINDEDYKNRVECIEEKVNQLKTEYNYLSNLANSMDKTYTNIKPYLLHHESSGLNYLNLRIHEKHNHAEAILRHLKKQQKHLYGFLYHPLIQCVRSIAKFHGLKFCVSSNQCSLKLANKGKLYVLSNILLFIFENTDINIMGYDQFSHWDATNIFAHPIISCLDEQIDTNVMLNKPFFSNTISPRWLPIIIENTLQEIENGYYISLVQDFILLTGICALKHSNYNFQTIFRIDEVGFHLYSYLLGDLKTKEILCLFTKSKNIKKQKFIQMSQH